MANYPSAIKRNRQAPKRRARNRLLVGPMRAALRAARAAIGGKSKKAEKTALFKRAVQAVDKAVSKGVMKRTTASRTISRLTRAFNKG